VVTERLLGFDARQISSNLNLWDRQRRQTFLLDTGVERPLSVDPIIWPSVFDTGQGIGLPAAERQRLGLAGIETPSWIGPNAGLWESLTAMREFLGANRLQVLPYAIVAVSWFSDRDFAEAGGVGPYLSGTSPAANSPDWRLLGLDVADGSLVSGLANCGYSEVELRELRPQWKTRLNAGHLLNDVVDAFRFRDLANKRVPEHAPFFVYGLYLVEEVRQLNRT